MGLTAQGFTPKSLTDIRTDIGNRLKLALGSDLDVSATSRTGQFIDITSDEINDVWQGLQDVYNSSFPDTASKSSLDNVVAITNTVRKTQSSSSANVFLAGDAATVVPGGSTIQKTGTDRNFTTQLSNTIPNTSNLIALSNVAQAGDITLSWDGTPIAAINWNDTTSAIETKIEAHADITAVTVTGGFDSLGFIHILFETDVLGSRAVTIDASTLTRNSDALVSNGYFSTDTGVAVLAVITGSTSVPQVSLTTIVSTVTGWNAVVNFGLGVAGNDEESDPNLRVRRDGELQKSGTATLGGARELIQAVVNVGSVTIIENDTSSTDSEGREPKSYEVYVEGGDDDDVAQAVYDSKPSGIRVVTTVAGPSQRTGNIIDVNGVATTLTFSEPVAVPMLIVVTGTKDADYPTDGDQQIKDTLVAFFLTFILNQDVLNHDLFTPVNTIPGLLTVVITQDTVAGGAPSTANTAIDVEEIATLINANITVTVT